MKTRKRQLIDLQNKLGLSISYHRKNQDGILRGQISQRPAKYAESLSSAAAKRSVAEGASALNYSLNAVNSALARASKCLNDHCFIKYDMKYQ